MPNRSGRTRKALTTLSSTDVAICFIAVFQRYVIPEVLHLRFTQISIRLTWFRRNPWEIAEK